MNNTIKLDINPPINKRVKKGWFNAKWIYPAKQCWVLVCLKDGSYKQLFMDDGFDDRYEWIINDDEKFNEEDIVYWRFLPNRPNNEVVA